MLKIYSACSQGAFVLVKDFIEFEYGVYNLGEDFQVFGGNVLFESEKINYDAIPLEKFEQGINLLNTKKMESFMLSNPKRYYDLLDEDFLLNKNHEGECLNEEAVLLFTNSIDLETNDTGLVEKIIDVDSYHAIYLLKPDSRITLSSSLNVSEYLKYDYELLHSNNTGKRLVLANMNRRIK